MNEREKFWQLRLERFGNPNFAGPTLVAIAIEEASIRIATAIEKAGGGKPSGLSTTKSPETDDLPEELNNGSTPR